MELALDTAYFAAEKSKKILKSAKKELARTHRRRK